jgi:hypothetical protein
MVEDFTPAGITYLKIKNKNSPEILFLLEHFAIIEKLLYNENNININILLHLIKYQYPFHFSPEQADLIIRKEDTIDSIMTEFKKDPILFEDIINQLFNKGNSDKILIKKLQEFEIPDYKISNLLSNDNNSNRIIIPNNILTNNPQLAQWHRKLQTNIQQSSIILNSNIRNISSSNLN